MSADLNPTGKRPNLILITTDQQRGDCLGCDGHPCLETPYLDEMAEQGVHFATAYTSVPSCTPARSGILSGMDQWNHGRLTMAGGDALEFPATMPGELAKAGYHTQAVGKMHFGPQRRLYGFHNMVLDESSRRIGNFVSDYHEWFDENKEGPYGYRDHSIDWNSWMGRPSHLPEHLHPTWWTANEGVKFIKHRDPTKPFFMWLSFARPHSPYDPPQTYYDMYINNENVPKAAVGDWCEEFDNKTANTNAPFTHRTDEEVHRGRAAYYGNITFIDHQIGRFLYEFRHFDPENFANSFIIFTSDHGDMMGDHYHWRKTYAYEGSARIPFIVKYPSGWKVERNVKSDKPIELRDIMPTMLDAAGVSIPESVDGESLLNITRGRDDWREFVQGEHTGCYTMEQGMQYVTDGKEKYIWFHHTGKELFFDLQDDPLECHDLSKDPDALSQIQTWRQRLAKINEDRGDPRGQDGELVVQEKAITLTDNYYKWKDRAAEAIESGFRY
jgi:arylsulfatase